jgi:hypothetical protein
MRPEGRWTLTGTRSSNELGSTPEPPAGWDPAAEVQRIRRGLAEVGSPFRTAERFGVQDLIDPRDSRSLLCAWVGDAYRILPQLTGRPAFGTRP